MRIGCTPEDICWCRIFIVLGIHDYRPMVIGLKLVSTY